MTSNPLPLQGVRVLELAVFIAAPTCTKTLSDLGAEVIKVESKDGDSLRKLMAEAMPGRPWSAFFDVINMDKKFVCIDAKKEEGGSGISLHQLLEQADVFVTNIRPAGLDRMGLNYATVSKRHPHLIYAHLTAWGLGGPDAELPGYDIGAFWAMTGMAAQAALAPNYHSLPVGFGDTTTGTCLAAGIMNGLIKRQKTGRGMEVETSLFGAGLWTAAGGLLNASGNAKWEVQSDSKIPTYPEGNGVCPDPMNTMLTTKDEFRVAVSLDGQGAKKDAEVQEAVRELTGKAGLEGVKELRSIVAKITLKQAKKKLAKAGIPHQLVYAFRNADDIVMKEGKGGVYKGWSGPLHAANLFSDGKGMFKDVRFFVRSPYDIDGHACGKKITSPPRPIGYHNKAVKAKGWESSKVSYPPPGALVPGLPLEGLTIVEFGEATEHSVALGTRTLADAGAKVVRVALQKDEEALRARSHEFYAHLVAGKEVITTPDFDSAVAEVARLVSGGADALITNLPEDLLKASGVAALQGSNPGLVYLLVTPWGLGKDGPRGELLSFWAAGGVPNYIAGAPDPPSYFGAALTALHVGCLAGAMLFRKQVTGKGGFGHTSLIGCGAWCVLSMLILGQVNPLNALFIRDETGYIRKDINMYNPVCTITTPKTKDGQLIQLLGAEWPRHFVRTYNTINATRSTQLRGVATLFTYTIPAALIYKLTGKDWKRALLPILRIFNSTVFQGFSERDWEDVRKDLDKNEVWYCRVRSPGQVFDSEQARVTGRITKESGIVRIASPSVYIEQPSAPAPKL
eukprot:Hpha_TRINITY_DN12063_c0_g1::TRINITY_DN12063_c0_g1_i1::g.140963::m.140963